MFQPAASIGPRQATLAAAAKPGIKFAWSYSQLQKKGLESLKQ